MFERFLGPSLDSHFRPLVALAAVVAALAHIPVIKPHLTEAPYMGGLFILLTTACLVLAATLACHDAQVVYGLSVLTCGLAVIGYAATRLVAFPMLSDDVGNWLEPLGIVSIASETVVVVSAGLAIRGRRRAHTTSSQFA
ncbi:hypothetical protein [Flexivirga oryzae]|uniref:UDP-N-acetylmuramyl pentapeptide phosphotransferase/UDP-N-acetylglucosamine-1-phosphate transferase n=1 Tax=Flexivirga oryzae TaxID=1794944 RepID=A0A839N493_9MICO|nr:hypothetical protein [Flexivirga oryzae]MBB2891579.1 UDP-N-acetylmuramyl pentapeptide phosphotransferase/UDP-N-acetylglucosamine-1-phosphate transferase [Flexivirga oryzae]